ncbi:MAG TPA: DUF2249 domain-containing protein [Solirubrobacteraceae bacterium]|nr:DUF2249 domain-containing protein [Solirubrobacteraceae bacterium]
MTVQNASATRTEPLAGLTAVLIDALRALDAAGQPGPACRLAGRAYAVLRHEHPVHAQRINALMHRLVRTPATTEEQSMPTTDPQLDVRTEPPARRHALIFDTYAGLTAGNGFVLVNDHDPKPLYYQLAAEHPDQFSWDYLEQGPEVWRVRIGRPA